MFLALASHCTWRENCTCTNLQEAVIVRLNGEGTILVLKPALVEEVYGSKYEELSLYWRYAGWHTERGEGVFYDGPLYPASRFSPITISISEKNLRMKGAIHNVLLYAREKQEAASIHVNLDTGLVVIAEKTKVDKKKIELQDGTLM
jgi:hypothetical protein